MGEGVLTDGFPRLNGTLHAEQVPLARIAEVAGTPTYIYSTAVLRDRYRRLTGVLEGIPHRVHYSLKANANRALLGVLREMGCGADVVSGGELFKALRAGFAPREIIFGGVGKTAAELREGLVAGVKLINVESLAELRLLDGIARELGVTAPVGLRINPEVDVENAHHYIATGEKGHKFGIPFDEAMAVGHAAIAMPHIRLVGLDMHIGSQLHSFDAYRAGSARLVELTRALREAGAPIQFLDVGGGLPVPYSDEDEPDLASYGAILAQAVRGLEVELLVEPGRFFSAAAGLLLTRVLYRKSTGEKRYVICDAGMTELLRPSHYEAYHRIEPVESIAGASVVDVVGPVCESGDFLALDRPLAPVEPGALLAVFTAGAYGYVMSSTYNARPRVAEVLVDGARFAIVTAREQYEDLVRLEFPEPSWRDG